MIQKIFYIITLIFLVTIMKDTELTVLQMALGTVIAAGLTWLVIRPEEEEE